MSEQTETHLTSQPVAGSRRRKAMRMVPAKLRAQRASARLSTGRRFAMSSIVRKHPESCGADLSEVRRLWQDVITVFWFVDPEGHNYLQPSTDVLEGTGSVREAVEGRLGTLRRTLETEYPPG